MGINGRIRRCVSLATVLLACCGCTPRDNSDPASIDAMSRLPVTGTVPVQRVGALQRDLGDSAARIRELEQQLAERDREIASVRSQIAAVNASPSGAAAPSAPAAAPDGDHPGVSAASAGKPGDTAPAIKGPDASTGSAAERSGAAPPGLTTSADQRLAQAQKRIVRLEQQLASELKRRREVEAEMDRLLQETSAGPYEHADNALETHLREELDRARREVNELRNTVRAERRERNEIERRYAALQAQVQSTTAVATREPQSEELEALKERQRRVLASIQQDLELSKQRETELRRSVEESQGADAGALTETVTTLRSENSALQVRLDDEHRRNRDLSAKLQLATRVTDLIYKMQTAGAQPMPVVPLPVSPR